MLREGKHGLVEEGQGETKAQVKDVPDNYSSKKKKKKKTPLRVHKILAAVRCVTTICKS